MFFQNIEYYVTTILTKEINPSYRIIGNRYTDEVEGIPSLDLDH